MALVFKRVDFAHELNVFVNLRKMAEIEVAGEFSHDQLKIQNYINRCLDSLGPDAFLHAYDEQRDLIGQIELSIIDNRGYIHLFYLLPKYRAQGYFKIMHAKVLDIFYERGLNCIRLATTVNNKKAIAIYEKYGWKNIGIHPDKIDNLIFEYLL